MIIKHKVLHLFNHYLPQTENWSYKVIKNTPNIQVFIGARVYLKNNFYDSNFSFAEHPFGEVDTYYSKLDNGGIFQKIAIKFLHLFLGTPQRHITKFAKAHQVDIIHAHFADLAWYFKKIPEHLNKPFIVSFYGWDYEQLPTTKPEYKKHYKTLFKQVSAIICEGNHGAQVLKKMGCPEAKIKVVPLGVEVKQIPFHHREKKNNELHLLQLATFNEKKGHIYTVKAFAKALKKCPNMTLTLVGGEGQVGIKEEVIQFIQDNSLKNKVKILDFVNYAHLYDFLKKFQVFIHPSCYALDRDCEGGAPIVILDAQATGMPVISTKHCDIPMEVIHQETGLLANEKEVDEIAQHIETFYKMDALEYAEYAQKAREHIQVNFDSPKNANALKKIYDNLG